jgi:hypothetical protein
MFADTKDDRYLEEYERLLKKKRQAERVRVGMKKARVTSKKVKPRKKRKL